MILQFTKPRTTECFGLAYSMEQGYSISELLEMPAHS